MNSPLLEQISCLILEVTRTHTVRRKIYKGQAVDVVLKKDQRTGRLTRGRVKKILTPGEIHTRGIKVMLHNGKVGRVQRVLEQEQTEI